MLKAVTHISLVNFLLIGVTTITGPVVARLLGPEGRGELAVVMLWPTVLAGVALLGTDVSLGRQAAKPEVSVRALRRHATRLSWLLGLVAAGIGVLAMPWLLPAGKARLLPTTWVALSHIPAGIFTNFSVAIALSAGRLWGYNLPRMMFSCAYLLLVMLLWFLHWNEVLWVAGAFSLSAGITAIFAWVLLGSGHPVGEPAAPELRMGDTVRTSLGFGWAALLETANAQLPLMLMSFLMPAAQIGLYAVAVTAASLQEAFGGAVGKVVFAQVAADGDTATAGGPSQHERGLRLAQQIRYAILVYFGLAAGMLVVIPPLMPIVFGEAFASTRWIVMGMIPAASVVAVGRIYNEALKGAGQSRPAVWARIIGSLVLVALAVLLVPRWQVMGMVAAVAGGAVAQFVCFARAAAEHFHVPLTEMWGVRLRDMRVLLGAVRKYLPGPGRA